MRFPITYAGFFAPSDNLFFLLLSFLFCPPLKNDGTSELRFRETVNDFSPKKKSIQTASRPRTREASEPLFEEQSDAVKVSETLCLG